MSSQQLRATFETWVVNKDGALAREIPGQFEVEIRLLPNGKGAAAKFRYRATCGGNPFGETFAESKLADCQSYVRSQFKKQLTDWT